MVVRISDKSGFRFEIDVSHLQIAIFHAGLENPFNQWTQAHTDQGFSWRPESVSFRPLDDGKAATYVETVRELALRPDTIRAIQVPFRVPENDLIEIGSIIESRVIEMKPGTYQLLYQTGFDKQDVMWCEFGFRETEKPTFQILRADEELSSACLILTDNDYF